jgi:hypothetical protein
MNIFSRIIPEDKFPIIKAKYNVIEPYYMVYSTPDELIMIIFNS